MSVKVNGEYSSCCVQNWAEHREEITQIGGKVDTMHTMLQTLASHTAHLSKLDCLPRIEDKLINAATSKDNMSPATSMIIFRILGVVILGLIGCIAFLLMGEHFGIIGALHH